MRSFITSRLKTKSNQSTMKPTLRKLGIDFQRRTRTTQWGNESVLNKLY